MTAPTPARRVRRAGVALATFGLVAAVGTGTAAGHGTWDGEFHAEAEAGYLGLDAELLGQDLADVSLFPSVAQVDSEAELTTNSVNAHARGANLDASLLGAVDLSGILSAATKDSPPNGDPVQATLLPVPAAPLLDVAASNAIADTQWLGAGVCPDPGDPYALATTDVAQATVLDVDDTVGVQLATVNNTTGGLFATRTWVERTEGFPGGIRSVAQAQTLSTTLFAGTPAQTQIDVVGTFEMTAEANGTSAATGVTWPIVTITLPDTTVIGPVFADELDPVVVPLSGALDGLLGAVGVGSLTIDAGYMETNNTDGATTAEISGAMLTVDAELALAGLPVLDVDLDLAPLRAVAHTPEGIDCGEPPVSTTSSTAAPSSSTTAAGPTTTDGSRGGTLADTGSGNTAMVAGAFILLTMGAWFLVSRSHVLARAHARSDR